MAEVKMSDIAGMTAFTGTEVFVGLQGGDTKVGGASQFATYVAGVLLGADAESPASGDSLLIERGGAARRLGLDAAAEYAVMTVWAAAGTATDAASGDSLLIERLGVLYDLTVDDLATYVLDGVQDGVLNISGLDAATLTDSDQYLVVQGATATKTTWAAIAARAHSQFSTAVAALGAVVTPGDTDKFYCLQGSTAKYVTLSVLAAHIEAEVSPGIIEDIFTADAVSPVVATDVFAVERTGAHKKATAEAVGAYTSGLLTGAAAVTPAATGDKFLLARGGVAKTADIDVLAVYAADKAVEAADTVVSVAGGDLVVLARSDAVKTIGVDTLKDHVLDGAQADILDISGLAAATLADAQLVPICDAGVAKQQTLANVGAHVLGRLRAYVAGRSDGAPLVDDDMLYVARAASQVKVTAGDMATYVIATAWDQSAAPDTSDADQVLTYRSGSGYQLTTLEQVADHVADAVEAQILDMFDAAWELVPAANYTATPDSTSKILMSDTTGMQVGLPLRYTYGGVAYYGVVAGVTANVEITVRGAPLNTGADLTELRVGPPSHVLVEQVLIPGAYLVPWHVPGGDGTQDLLAEIARRSMAWAHGPAKLVAMAVAQGTEDGAAQPKFNAKIDGNTVVTADGGAGVQVSATPGQWTWASAVAIDANEYSIATDDAIEILCTAAGSDGDAGDLSVRLVFVLE